MSAAPLTAEPGVASGPQDQAKNQCGRLLGLVRKLIDYGRDLVASLQQQNDPTPSVDVARRFGTLNVALIIARISRGLAIAAGLEARLLRWPPVQDRLPEPDAQSGHPAKSPQPDPNRPRRARPTFRRPPPLSQAEDDAALLRGLPSAQEIAARLRGRTAGEVIVEICRDLGIKPSHPLWLDIRDAIIRYDGSLAKLLLVWVNREVVFATVPDEIAEARMTALAWLVEDSTGPP